jgi:chemotaxis protein CheD
LKHTIGVAEMHVSNSAEDLLITHSLGSCLGIVLFDAVAGVGGMLHAMLPTSQINPEKARENPCMFIDSGVPHLFRQCYELGATKRNLTIKVAGGAVTAAGQQREDMFSIGSRNMTILRKLLWKNGVMLKAADVGGSSPRTLSLDMSNGEVLVRINGTATAL